MNRIQTSVSTFRQQFLDRLSLRQQHMLLLLCWFLLGLGLRLSHLTAKSPWVDEMLTLAYSGGQGFQSFPLDQVLSLEQLLIPLQFRPELGLSEITQNILAVSVHPPLYFFLAHEWMKLFPTDDGGVSLWAARALPTLLGSLLIPGAFVLARVGFRSLRVAHISAMLMAVSPFAIYLSQEARHYTLAMVWVTLSLACLVTTMRLLMTQQVLPPGLMGIWTIVNILGISTHFFMLITLMAEAMALMAIHFMGTVPKRFSTSWRRLSGMALGTGCGGLAWLPILQAVQTHEATQWIQGGDRFTLSALFNPIAQLMGTWITIVSLLPVEVEQLWIVIPSGLVMLLFFVWCVPILKRGLTTQLQDPKTGLITQVLGWFVVSAILLFFLIIYGLGVDLTRGARYSFVYFPAVIILVGVSLAVNGGGVEGQPSQILSPNQHNQSLNRHQMTIFVFGLMGLISALTVVFNMGYQKYYRPDQLVALIQKQDTPVLVATTQKTVVEIGELMSIGWEWKRSGISQVSPPRSGTPQFLLAQGRACPEKCSATETLAQNVAPLPRPLDVWLVNFKAPADLTSQGCQLAVQPQRSIDGYRFQKYLCR